jgi:hypothetical protein
MLGITCQDSSIDNLRIRFFVSTYVYPLSMDVFCGG